MHVEPIDDRLDLLLRALADCTRRALLDRLRDAPGLTLSQLLQGFPQTRQALSKHLALLEEVDLVVPVWRGREKLHYLNPAPLQALPSRWVTASAGEDRAALKALRAATEPKPVAEPARAARRGAAAPDALTALLLRPPAALLQGQPVQHAAALEAAREYLADTARAVTALLRALGPQQGYEPPAEGGFCLAEHLWHLADIEELGWRQRFERILAERQPRLPGVDGDRLAIDQRYRTRPWRGAARRFLVQRRHTLRALHAFDTEVLQRPVHFAGARTRAGGVLAAAVAHDLDHRPAMADRWREIAAAAAPAPTRRAR